MPDTIKEWLTPAALIAVVGFLWSINSSIDRNCDAIAQTNAQIRVTLEVAATGAQRDEDRESLKQRAMDFPHPSC